MSNGKCSECGQFWDNHGLVGRKIVCPEFVLPFKASPYNVKKPDQFTPVGGDHHVSGMPMEDWLPDNFEQLMSGSPAVADVAWWDEFMGGH